MTWFEYPIQVYPHHTDYAGIVWHGTYITWMEEARVQCLQEAGLPFETLVAMGCDLPVVELAVRYRRSMRHGAQGNLKARMLPVGGVRLIWEYELWEGEELCLTAQVTLVAIDRGSGKILRRLPEFLTGILDQMPWLVANKPD
jgi:acyl-CoA thioester hydrolase